MGSGNAPTLTTGDAEAIAKLPNVQAGRAHLPRRRAGGLRHQQLGHAGAGRDAEYTSVRDWPVESGEPIGERTSAAPRAWRPGRDGGREALRYENPVGKTTRIRGQPFQFVGVLKKKGQSLDGRDQTIPCSCRSRPAQSKLFGNRFPGTVRFMFVQGRAGGDRRRGERHHPAAGASATASSPTRTTNSRCETTPRRPRPPRPRRASSRSCSGIGSISLVVGASAS